MQPPTLVHANSCDDTDEFTVCLQPPAFWSAHHSCPPRSPREGHWVFLLKCVSFPLKYPCFSFVGERILLQQIRKKCYSIWIQVCKWGIWHIFCFSHTLCQYVTGVGPCFQSGCFLTWSISVRLWSSFSMLADVPAVRKSMLSNKTLDHSHNPPEIQSRLPPRQDKRIWYPLLLGSNVYNSQTSYSRNKTREMRHLLMCRNSSETLCLRFSHWPRAHADAVKTHSLLSDIA